jgi:ClpP class serine protease
MNFISRYKRKLIGTTLVGGIVGVSTYAYNRYNSKKRDSGHDPNIIVIKHGNDCSTFLKKMAMILLKQEIDISTYFKFVRDFRKADTNHLIRIVIQTHGGDLLATDMICNFILNYKGSGGIRCYVPCYALSGGTMIALCCDEIVMTKTSILSPCDAQMSFKESQYAASDVTKMIESKEAFKEQIQEEWRILGNMCNKVIRMQNNTLDKLCNKKGYDADTRKKIAEEFFGGKYVHDKMFSVQDIKDMGTQLRVTEVERMPDYILHELEID